MIERGGMGMNKRLKNLTMIALSISTILCGCTTAKDNNRAEVSEQTQKEAEEYLKVYYRSLVIDKCEMSVEEYEPETNSEYISYVKAGDEAYSYASYVFYGTMDTPDAKGDSVIIYMSDSVKSPYYSINGNDKWNMSIVQNKPDGAKTWNYAFTER